MIYLTEFTENLLRNHFSLYTIGIIVFFDLNITIDVNIDTNYQFL